MTPPLWHLLQVSDVLDLELASALAESVPVLAWQPERTLRPAQILPGGEQERPGTPTDGFTSTPQTQTLRIRNLPLLRGFARPPISWIARTGPQVLERLLAQTPDATHSTLICSVPYFAAVAEQWPGPVIYWLTDLIAAYSSADRNQVVALDRRMCAAATLVCPNSERLKSYFLTQAACDPAKIEVIPNATRASNLLPAPPISPAPLPPSAQHLSRPIAGVVGNLAGNMDWLLLEKLVAFTPWLSWLFVGPTSMHMRDRAARQARAALMADPRCLFVGRQPYGDLAAYAQSFDVAVLPYLRCEPTYSGSSTRFYEHLAACRPMIATRGLEELTRKPPLLTLVDTVEQAVAAVNHLRTVNFDDGLCTARWQASQQGTWQFRAQTIQRALAARLPTPSSSASEITVR